MLTKQNEEYPVRGRWVKFKDRFPDDGVGVVMRNPSSSNPIAAQGIEDWINDDAECIHHMEALDGYVGDWELIRDGWEWLEIMEDE